MRADQIEWPAGDRAARVLGASPRKRALLAGLALQPLAFLYGVGVRLRNGAYDLGLLPSRRGGIPVISVGNIVAGGAGKTPFTRWLVERLSARGARVAVLHGGYASDEPALHRQWLPDAVVIAQRDRVHGVAVAAAADAAVVVLDDAFQHRRLARDLDIVLVPAESPSLRLLPAGPLREPRTSLARADVIVVTRKTESPARAKELAGQLQAEFRKPVAVAAILPDRMRPLMAADRAPPRQAMIVSAIARPDLLLAQVNDKLTVTRMLAYPDHHEFSADDVEYIRNAAQGGVVLMTEKDAVKLASRMGATDIWVLEQKVAIEFGFEHLEAALEKVL